MKFNLKRKHNDDTNCFAKFIKRQYIKDFEMFIDIVEHFILESIRENKHNNNFITFKNFEKNSSIDEIEIFVDN